MAFNFPASPAIGDESNGYRWDGQKWMLIGTGGSSSAGSIALVATIAALEALDPVSTPAAILTEGRRGGTFVWQSGDYTTFVASDPLKGVFVKANSVAVTVGAWQRIYDGVLNLAWFGNLYGGNFDMRATLAAADAFAVARGDALQITGICKISSAITVTTPLLFVPDGMLKPDSGVLIKLRNAPAAGLYQIFDRSAGGAIEFTESRVPFVYVEWWGAKGGTNGRTDNQIPIQHAIDSLQVAIVSDFSPAANANNNGGECRFGNTTAYLVSGRIHTRNGITLKGTGSFCALRANAATWNPVSTEMWLSMNTDAIPAGVSQFWCKAENLSFDASSVPAITRVIYAPSWQESCGLRDVRVYGYTRTGLRVDSAYGGSIGFKITSVQFTPSNTLTVFPVIAIDVDVPSPVYHYQVLLEEVSFSSGFTGVLPGELIGFNGTGIMDIICRGVYGERVSVIMSLNTGACLFGDLRPGSTSNVRDVIAITNTPPWTGRINATVSSKVAATNLLRSSDAAANTLYKNNAPYDGQIVYPHTPSQVLACGQVTGGTGTPALAQSYGISGVTKVSTGIYRLTFDTALFNPSSGTHYESRIFPSSLPGHFSYTNAEITTHMEVAFKNMAGTLSDISAFFFEIYARPGL